MCLFVYVPFYIMEEEARVSVCLSIFLMQEEGIMSVWLSTIYPPIYRMQGEASV